MFVIDQAKTLAVTREIFTITHNSADHDRNGPYGLSDNATGQSYHCSQDQKDDGVQALTTLQGVSPAFRNLCGSMLAK